MIGIRKTWALSIAFFLAIMGGGAIVIVASGSASAENLNVPTTITVGTISRVVNGINRSRGTDELILYSTDFGTNTGTNQWGVEAVVHCTGSPLTCVVQSVRDRQPTQDLTPTTIPAKPDFVISGHGVSADWMRSNVSVGKSVILKDSAGAQTFWPGGGAAPSTTASPTSSTPASTSASTSAAGSPTATCTPTGAYNLGISNLNGGYVQANQWQANHAIRAVGTWSDDPSDPNIYHLSTDMASWNGIVDIAVGGLASGQTWSAAAAGSYNTAWQTKFTNLKNAWGSRPPGNLYVRIAHEFNGSFSGWYANDANATNFVGAFRRWATLLQQTIPGAHPVWSPNDGSNVTHIDSFWPGSDKVDLIAVDKYNGWPHRTTAADITAALTEKDGNSNPVGAEAWRLYALSKGVPMGFGEIGNPANSADAGGGGDAPEWFNVMESWSEQHAGTAPGNVTYGIWFDEAGFNAHYQFYIPGSGADPAQPNFAGRFQQAQIYNGPSCQTPSASPTSASATPTPTSTTPTTTPTSSTASITPTASTTGTCAPNSTVTATQTVTQTVTAPVTDTASPGVSSPVAS